MNRDFSLKRKKEFNYVYRNGKSYGSKLLVVVYFKTNRDLKIGFSVSKKVGNAVVRNKVKRRLKEIVSLEIPNIKKDYSIIFIARPQIVEASFEEIKSLSDYLLRKTNLTL